MHINLHPMGPSKTRQRKHDDTRSGENDLLKKRVLKVMPAADRPSNSTEWLALVVQSCNDATEGS
jgi:hypothetical protein